MNKGIKKGLHEGKAEDLMNLMRNLNWNIEQALQGLSIPENEWDDYRALVKEMESKTLQ